MAALSADDWRRADIVPLKLALLGWRGAALPLVMPSGAVGAAADYQAALAFLLEACGKGPKQRGVAVENETAMRSVARLSAAIKALGLGDDAAAAASAPPTTPAAAKLLEVLCDRALATSCALSMPVYPAASSDECNAANAGIVVEEDRDDIYGEDDKLNIAMLEGARDVGEPAELPVTAAAWAAETAQAAGRLEKAEAQVEEAAGRPHWRTRLADAGAAAALASARMPAVVPALTALAEATAGESAAVRDREATMRSDPVLAPLFAALSTAVDGRKAARAVAAKRASVVEEISAATAAEEAALAAARAAVEARANSLADTAPLTELRRALDALRAETRELNLRLGYARHALLAARVAEGARATAAKAAPSKSPSTRSGGGADDDASSDGNDDSTNSDGER